MLALDARQLMATRGLGKSAAQTEKKKEESAKVQLNDDAHEQGRDNDSADTQVLEESGSEGAKNASKVEETNEQNEASKTSSN